MALSTRPRVLLLDEVAAGLTDAEVEEVAALVRRLRDGLGVAVVWIEHAVGAVLRTVERVAVLDHGRLLADGSPLTVSRDPTVVSAYLGAEAAQ
jgi:ABC-type branched-subunit amino acid transport system ATPase component